MIDISQVFTHLPHFLAVHAFSLHFISQNTCKYSQIIKLGQNIFAAMHLNI